MTIVECKKNLNCARNSNMFINLVAGSRSIVESGGWKLATARVVVHRKVQIIVDRELRVGVHRELRVVIYRELRVVVDGKLGGVANRVSRALHEGSGEHGVVAVETSLVDLRGNMGRGSRGQVGHKRGADRVGHYRFLLDRGLGQELRVG